jgi:hypothetical protein
LAAAYRLNKNDRQPSLSVPSRLHTGNTTAGTSRGQPLEKLKYILDTAHRGIVVLDTSLKESLTFYRSKVEESVICLRLSLWRPHTTRSARALLSMDFFNGKMRRNLELYRHHAESFRKKKPLTRSGMQKNSNKGECHV